jgi:hypothetical protein
MKTQSPLAATASVFRRQLGGKPLKRLPRVVRLRDCRTWPPNLAVQQTRARRKRPLSCKRTRPLAKRSATVATVSLLLLAEELTARMRSPSESLVRGFKIWRFLFISCPFPFVAILMPSAIVNTSSMTRCAVIPFLYTLKLTVERHFCSIFEHKVLDGPMEKRAISASQPALTSARSIS